VIWLAWVAGLRSRIDTGEERFFANRPGSEDVAGFGLAGLGVVLATAGLFALVAYSVVDQRSLELAVRLAIGADPGTILKMVVWQGGRFAVAGLVMGIVLSMAVANRMSSLLFQVAARDGLTFLAAVSLLGATALLASYLAARRVIRIDPVLAMRAQ